MNILYITSSFTKSGSASVRNISLVNGLIENGHNVDVLTQEWPSHMKDYYLEKNINEKINVYYDKIKIIELYFNNIASNNKKINRNFLFTKVKEIIKKVYYFPDIDKEWVLKYNKNILNNNYDLIISSSDTKTCHFVAEKLIKKNIGKKWFQIWGDPWFYDKGTTGIRKVRALFKEKNIISMADKVFYISEPTLSAQKAKYKKNSKKMLHLKRAYFNEIISNKKPDKSELIFSYIGSIYYGRNINPILDAIDKFNKNNDYNIKLNIYGSCGNEIDLITEKYKFVNFFGYINYGKVEEITRESDALIFLGNWGDSNQIPGKLFDYFGTNKAVIALLEDMDSEVAKFIIKTNRCIVLENKLEKIDMNSIVSEIVNTEYKPLREYSRKAVAKELIEIYEKEEE